MAMNTTRFFSWRNRLPAPRTLLWGLTAAAGGLFALHCGSSYLAGRQPPAAGPAAFQQAASYSRAHSGLAMLIMKDREIVYEDYARGVTPDQPLNLYSGTKSFSCAIAAAAAQDGLLDLDEPVAQTIGEWRSDALKSRIAIRHLLSLTSGLDAGERGSIPSYAGAIQAEALFAPGAVFQYGPNPYQAFGEVMRRKLQSSGESPLDYLKRRVFEPIGLTVGRWRTDSAGNPRLPAGAFLTAREWAKYGQFLLDGGRWGGVPLIDEHRLAECFKGSTANPAYGLTVWLPAQRGGVAAYSRTSTDPAALKLLAAGAGEELAEAAGRGGQKLYIVPSKRLVIVRMADRSGLWHWGFKDANFLDPILRHYGL
jgi:CubicO group peptidase (beta-lactamase class C family)